MKQEMIRRYAKLAIQKGVNVQQGQTLLINTSVSAIDMTRACVEEAYKAGAKEVVVQYNDEYVKRYAYEYQDEETLCMVRPFQIDSKLDYFKEGACILHIISEVPGVFKGLDAQKIGKAKYAMSIAGKEIHEYTMLNKTQWCIVAVPNEEWAMQVFPNTDKDEAMQLLWKHILEAVHVQEDNDPIAIWNTLGQRFHDHSKCLNEHEFETLHFKNEIGTDLSVGLVKHHVWAGGSDVTLETKVEFNPNMPTEEIFTMPQRDRVDGKVVASKPLLYNGELIEDFWLIFEHGKVIDFDARCGKEALSQLINFDEGSCYLGEVALVPYDSPISKSNVLFLNTLFDENASCHLALGDAYPTSVRGGECMSEEELQAAGANHSLTHVDFMFGTKDLQVVGKKANNEDVVIFEEGNFVI